MWTSFETVWNGNVAMNSRTKREAEISTPYIYTTKKKKAMFWFSYTFWNMNLVTVTYCIREHSGEHISQSCIYLYVCMVQYYHCTLTTLCVRLLMDDDISTSEIRPTSKCYKFNLLQWSQRVTRWHRIESLHVLEVKDGV